MNARTASAKWSKWRLKCWIMSRDCKKLNEGSGTCEHGTRRDRVAQEPRMRNDSNQDGNMSEWQRGHHSTSLDVVHVVPTEAPFPEKLAAVSVDNRPSPSRKGKLKQCWRHKCFSFFLSDQIRFLPFVEYDIPGSIEDFTTNEATRRPTARPVDVDVLLLVVRKDRVYWYWQPICGCEQQLQPQRPAGSRAGKVGFELTIKGLAVQIPTPICCHREALEVTASSTRRRKANFATEDGNSLCFCGCLNARCESLDWKRQLTIV